MNKTFTQESSSSFFPRPAPGPNAMGMPALGAAPLSQEELAALAEEEAVTTPVATPGSERNYNDPNLRAQEETLARNRDPNVQWGIRRWPAGTDISNMSPDDVNELAYDGEIILQDGEFWGIFGDFPKIVRPSREYSEFRDANPDGNSNISKIARVWEDEDGRLFVSGHGDKPSDYPALSKLAIIRTPQGEWASWVDPANMVAHNEGRGGRRKKSTKKRKSRKNKKSRKSKKTRKSRKSRK